MMDQSLFNVAYNAIECSRTNIGDAASAFQRVAEDLQRPHIVMRARVFLEKPGVWCCMYGECLADSPAGFGDSPARACADFDRRWLWSQAEIDAHDKAKESQ